MYIYIQSKNYFCFVRMCHSNKIYLHSIKTYLYTYIHLYIPIYTYICILIFSLFIFRIKNRSLFNRKKNVSNEIFLFNDFWESNLVFHLFVKWRKTFACSEL